MKRGNVGWISGFLGVLIFSGSLPATRVAVAVFDPIALTALRATIAGLLALPLLLITRQPMPSKGDIASLVTVALGVVVGFPLLTALALQYVTSAHAILFVGLLPIATALFGVLRAGDKPRPIFWLFAVLGSGCVVSYALFQIKGEGNLIGDGLMLAAIVVCGFGYAEGARLSRHLGGWQVISWALVVSLPVMVVLSVSYWPDWSRVDTPAYISLAYVSLFSMLIGFFFWYHGLARGGVAQIGQLQLLQPFFGLALAAGLLGEAVGWPLVAVTLAVVGCVAMSKKYS
ncbi:DMT family transporter [Lacibacterium aquatile]|uniref:DMT family transporter n=1 Tax=Lacibacterium aquatile TaxID=1168082 RepID=A0ABW5DU64_9PROT